MNTVNSWLAINFPRLKYIWTTKKIQLRFQNYLQLMIKFT